LRLVRARDVLASSELSRALSGYEDRPAQLEMADAVEAALGGGKHLFVEAGTGTGKTLAYLVPVLLSGHKVVVSTATKALQEQIFVKDLPLVREVLGAQGVTFKAALMKGLSNYLCKRRFDELRRSGEHAGDSILARLEAWTRETETGDRAELVDLREDAAIWREVEASSDVRDAAACARVEGCYVARMRNEAEEANLVVVNHHLFLADLALRTGRGEGFASAIPNYDAVILDEAHQLEDIATEFFGVRVSSRRVETLARDAERVLRSLGLLDVLGRGEARSLVDLVVDAGAAFFRAIGRSRGTGEPRRVLGAKDWDASVRDALGDLEARLVTLAAYAEEAKGKVLDPSLVAIGRRAIDVVADLRAVGQGSRAPDADEAESTVAWIDARERSVTIGASPIDVGPALRTRLFDRVSSVVCTSATLAVGQSFHFAKARLGAPPEADELVLASPFDFARRAALYLPADLPDPSDPAFEAAAGARVAELARLTGGGAFVLSTSVRAMKNLHARLRALGEFELLVQGEAPKHLLLSRFRASERAVLVATMSFWEGVDVPGRALRLVVLDKVPFAVPTDPVVGARSAAIDRHGGNSFTQYAVPSAAITLKQGFGRLIRSQRDYGVVGILDRRVTTKSYGRVLLKSLPPARRIGLLDDLAAWWRQIDEGHRS
jgi:ATP-dependent DNA helicase DinG